MYTKNVSNFDLYTPSKVRTIVYPLYSNFCLIRKVFEVHSWTSPGGATRPIRERYRPKSSRRRESFDHPEFFGELFRFREARWPKGRAKGHVWLNLLLLYMTHQNGTDNGRAYEPVNHHYYYEHGIPHFYGLKMFLGSNYKISSCQISQSRV